MRLKLRKGEHWQSSRLESAGFAFCGGMCSEPEAPDYSGIAAANAESARLSKEAADNQLAFSREQYDFLKPYIQRQLQIGQDVATQQQADSAKASDRADQQWSQYQTTFQPIEEKMAQEAMDYGSAADQVESRGGRGRGVDVSVALRFRDLDLKKPIYQRTAAYGHFGRDSFPWEVPRKLKY